MQRLAQVMIRGGEEQRLGTARLFSPGARLLGQFVLLLQLPDELLILVAQADLRDDRARLPIDEQDDVAEHRNPHDAERRVVVAPERDIAQGKQTEDRNGERVQRRREIGVRHHADRRAPSKAGGNQRDRQRLLGTDEDERGGAPDHARHSGGEREAPTPFPRRGFAIVRAPIGE